jgi:hypothetical protein
VRLSKPLDLKTGRSHPLPMSCAQGGTAVPYRASGLVHWPNSAVVVIRPQRQLLGDKLSTGPSIGNAIDSPEGTAGNV